MGILNKNQSVTNYDNDNDDDKQDVKDQDYGA